MLTPSPSLPLTPNDHHYKSISCREGFTDIDQEYVKINIMFQVYIIYLSCNLITYYCIVNEDERIDGKMNYCYIANDASHRESIRLLSYQCCFHIDCN